MELTRMEKVLWDNDLEKMLTNHLEDAEDMLEHTKGCPQAYQQTEADWAPQINHYKGRIAALNQAIKLIKCLEYNQKIKGE
tara:strand:+ start:45 stop:287 length:243 start_codon:yes stop_codon:yes gene_type:complete